MNFFGEYSMTKNFINANLSSYSTGMEKYLITLLFVPSAIVLSDAFIFIIRKPKSSNCDLPIELTVEAVAPESSRLETI